MPGSLVASLELPWHRCDFLCSLLLLLLLLCELRLVRFVTDYVVLCSVLSSASPSAACHDISKDCSQRRQLEEEDAAVTHT